MTPPGVGAAARAAQPIRRPGPRFGEARTAGDRAQPRPHHLHRPPGRSHRGTHTTVWLAGVCPQRGAAAAVLGGCGLVLSPRRPHRRHFSPPQEPRADRAAVGHAVRPNRGPHVPADVECGLRQSLQTAHTHLTGLHPEHGKKLTDTPTAERILNAFPAVSLTSLKTVAGEEILPWLTPVSA